MSNAMISALFAIGFAAWVYSKSYHGSGGNRVNAIVVAAGAGLLAFLGIVLLLGVLFK